MTRTASVTLAEHFATFVDVQVADGRYASAEDVVQAALRLLEEQEAHLVALRNALIDGENSGPASPFDFTAFLAEKRADNVR